MTPRATQIRDDRLVVEYDVDIEDTRPVWDHAARLRDEGWHLLWIDSQVRSYRAGWSFQPAQPAQLRFTVLYERVETQVS
jgi:hypothetical protein